MGWDESFLGDAVNTCTNLSGEIQDCPLFTIQDASVYGNCNITEPAALVSENVVNPSPSLPGNVPIASGPAYAEPASDASNPVVQIDNPTAGGIFAASTTDKPTTTPAPNPSVSYYSTQYLTSGQVVHEVLWIEELVTVTAADAATTVGVEARAHVHQHQRHIHHY
jgi:hypothetical protein